MATTTSNPMPGKRVGGSIYVHESAVHQLPATARRSIAVAGKIAGVDDCGFNVVKLEGDPATRVSLLVYQSFDAEPFPALLKSWSIDLGAKTCSARDYSRSKNPPILHRKELLLSADDPRQGLFSELTKSLESGGLFVDARRIGFQRTWRHRLATAGIEIRDHQIQVLSPNGDASAPGNVERHRTAIVRQSLSVPMQLLAQHGFLDEDRTIFDYGCGRGDDLGVLTAAGLNAKGWDPHYAPESPQEPAATVNLGFVLNVIEEPRQRTEALVQAFQLTQEVLAVSVMVLGKGNTTGLQPHGDGYLTSRGTFQKYYRQEEAQTFIQAALDEEAIPVAPGVFFVFSDKFAEQRFLESRHRRRRDISHLLTLSPPRTANASGKDQALIDENRDLIDTVWGRALEQGRLPQVDELTDDVNTAVSEVFGSIRKVIRLAQQAHDPKGLAESRAARIDDLTIYFALNQFNQRQRYRELPIELQRDIKAFFGTHAKAESEGREILFSLGDRRGVQEACREAASHRLGHLFGDHSLQLSTELIDRLPTLLRIYIGCAEKLYGTIGPEAANLVKIHMQSAKLTLLRYDNFSGSRLPRLIERVKIDMARTVIDHFDYAEVNASPCLIFKSRFMSPEQEGYDDQVAFEDKVRDVLEPFAKEADAPMDVVTAAIGAWEA